MLLRSLGLTPLLARVRVSLGVASRLLYPVRPMADSSQSSGGSSSGGGSGSGSSLSPGERAKQKAAHQAVDDHVRSGMCVGIGSGSTVVYAVERLVERSRSEQLQITCVASSFQATQLISDGGLQLSDLSRTPQLDVAIDGADEVDAQLNCIKGGGACMLQEKIVISCAKKFIIIADARKDSKTLGQQWKSGIPLEVVPMAHVPVMNRLKQMGAKPTLRMAGAKKAGPVVTDNGNFVVDADFGEVECARVAQLDEQLQRIVGVVETGLFVGMAHKAYFGQADGSVTSR